MPFATQYEATEPTREFIDTATGATMVEFGNAWCGWCRGAQPHIAAALEGHDAVRHVKVADGPGKRLGRSFRVKLWPTFVFLRDGQEVERLVRPGAAGPIREALARIEAQAR